MYLLWNRVSSGTKEEKMNKDKFKVGDYVKVKYKNIIGKIVQMETDDTLYLPFVKPKHKYMLVWASEEGYTENELRKLNKQEKIIESL